MERSQYQYTPIVEPVFVPAAAGYDPADLAWSPRDVVRWQDRPRAYYDLSVKPPEQYDPRGLQWQQSNPYYGRSLRSAYVDPSIYPLQPPAAPAYDPSNLEWTAKDSYSGRELGRSRYDTSIYPLQPPAVAPYDPAGLEWRAIDSYSGLTLPRALYDLSVYTIDSTEPVADAGPSSGRIVRRYRRYLRRTLSATDTIQIDNLAEERARVAEQVQLAELDELLYEQKLLRAAISSSSVRQVKSMRSMIDRLQKRIDQIERDDEDAIVLTI